MVQEWDLAGSRWWKFDFHSHTPASNCYGKGPDQDRLRTISPRDWLLNYMKAEIDCVAITDHNTGEWIDKLQNDLKELDTEKPFGYRKLYLFPGVEINVNGGFHILAILPEEATKQDVDYLLGAIRCQATPGMCDGITELAVKEVINEIISKHGIVIPAHADLEKGIFNNYDAHTLASILDNDNVFSVELANKNFSYPDIYIQRKLNWANILGSDSHHPNSSGYNTDAKYPGSHYTWIKMSKPTIEGVRLALLDGNTLSIKRSDDISVNPNDFDHMILEEITIKKAKYLGQGEGLEFICRFNPWLNTIIGGRGTGKSTILEFIRLCMNRKDEVPKSLEHDFKKYSEISESRGSENLLTNDTIIEIIIRKDKIRYKLKWQSKPEEVQIFEESSQNNWNKVKGSIKQRFPLRIFSQKQIFELSKDPLALLKIIDDAQEVGYRDWIEEKIIIEKQYLFLKEQVREKSNILEREPEILGEIDDINHRLRIFEDNRFSEILNKHNTAQAQESTLLKWMNTWTNSSENLAHFYQSIVPEKINDNILKDSTEIQKIQDTILGDFLKIQEKIRNIVDELNLVINNGKKSINESNLLIEIARCKDAYISLTQQLDQDIIFNLDEYQKLIKRRESLNSNLLQIADTKREISEIEIKIDDCFKKLESKRFEIQKKREEFLNELLKDNESVSIRILPFRDKQNLEFEFRKLIAKEDNRFEQDISKLLNKITEKSNTYGGLSNFKESIIKISSGDVQDLIDPRFGTYIQKMGPEKIDRIMCFFPEDSLEVRYKDPRRGGFVSIEQGSPGQRNAALLAFFLIYGTEPLILDQPEDDLDNQLIYNSIVTQLREIKQKRQVIVITHNANVVVNGDSENVIPLGINSSAQTVISGHGGLQEYQVRESICEILEGGKEAFESRYKRINVSR